MRKIILGLSQFISVTYGYFHDELFTEGQFHRG
ncbi:MAG: hypothetical protein ISR95_00845 [Candidatus Marinimicrobia bacterium]|nr:hypothetical protein [Candidatus Neomarinimicrobiota bacterium]